MKTKLLLVFLVAISLSIASGAFSKAAKKTVQKVPAGGANQLKGYEGKAGDMLFNGHIRFRVSSASFEAVEGWDFGEGQAGNKTFVVKVEMKNGDNSDAVFGGFNHEMSLVIDTPDQTDMLMTNNQMRRASKPLEEFESATILPGAGVKGCYVFVIAKDSKPKRLVFNSNIHENWPVFRVSF